MKPLHDPEVAAWISKADEDMAVVVTLREHASHLDAAICFHCQQAAEKMLKALLVSLGEVPPHTHDLATLVERSAVHLPIVEDLLTDATYLSPFAVLPRYPVAPSPGIEPERLVAEVEARARRIAETIRALLSGTTAPRAR